MNATEAAHVPKVHHHKYPNMKMTLADGRKEKKCVGTETSIAKLRKLLGIQY
jgi:hypothetical protein